LPPFGFKGGASSPISVTLGAPKYVLVTRSSMTVDPRPPESPIRRLPEAFRALRRGPSGVGFIAGSKDLRKRVEMRGKKHDLDI